MAKKVPTILTPKVKLKNKSDDELLLLRIGLEKEFKVRMIKFTTAEIGETLVIKYFINKAGLPNLQRAPPGTKNVDALSRDGHRYSIKSIKEGNKTGTIYPDREDENKQLFEYLVIVQINEDYEIRMLHRVAWSQFLKIRQWDKTMNAWYVAKTQKALKQCECLYERHNNEVY